MKPNLTPRYIDNAERIFNNVWIATKNVRDAMIAVLNWTHNPSRQHMEGIRRPYVDVLEACCVQLEVHPCFVRPGRRGAKEANARAVAIWILRGRGLSWPKCAAVVGMENHTSAIAAYRKIERLPELKTIAESVKAGLQ
jgi:chromosomal replication initiation ATPase DnaA